jgi:hypothetical protein
MASKTAMDRLISEFDIFKTNRTQLEQGAALPSFQYGGTVPGPIGSAQLAVVHGGETITPAGQRALTVAQTINFNVQAMDAVDVARFLEQQKGTIAAVVGEAARDSEGFRQLLGGG